MSDIRSVIRTDGYRAYIGLLCCDKGIDAERLSDFELFAFLCDNIADIYGSPLYGELSAILSPYADITSLCERETQKGLWRVLNGDKSLKLDIAKERIWNSDIHVKREDKTCARIMLNRVIERNNDLPEALDVLIEQIADSNDNILIDLDGLNFERPDKYHAELVYGRIINGERCTCESEFALITWIICRVLMRRNAKLYILPDKEFLTVAKLLDLMSCRKLYPPICIIAESKRSALRACELCLYGAQKNISLEIAVSKENDKNIGADIISSVLELVPVTRVYADSECEA